MNDERKITSVCILKATAAMPRLHVTAPSRDFVLIRGCGQWSHEMLVTLAKTPLNLMESLFFYVHVLHVLSFNHIKTNLKITVLRASCQFSPSNPVVEALYICLKSGCRYLHFLSHLNIICRNTPGRRLGNT